MAIFFKFVGGAGDGYVGRATEAPNVIYYNIPQNPDEKPVHTVVSPIWGKDWTRTQRYAWYGKIADVDIYKPQNIGEE
jgi:hypothetical protein